MKNIDNLNQFQTWLLNQPLVQIQPTLASIQPSLFKNEEGSIFFGTGLCTPTHLTTGIPFDALGMVLFAELLRRSLGLKTVFHQIADMHAMTNSFNHNEVTALSKKVMTTFKTIITNLEFDSFEVVFASRIQEDPLHKKIKDQLKNRADHAYILNEIADIEWFRQKHRVNLKVGWTIQNSDTELGNDERIFDQLHREAFGSNVSSIFLKPGRTFDKSRQNVSPYISIPGESRIMLDKGEDITGKIKRFSKDWEDENWGGTRKHLANIVRLFELLFGNLTGLSFEEKLSFIQRKAFN